MLFIPFLTSCENVTNAKKEAFNKSLQGYYSRDIDFQDKMTISKGGNYLFCKLTGEEGILFCKKINNNQTLEEDYIVLHEFPNEEYFLKIASNLEDYQKAKKIKVTEIFYKPQNKFALNLNDLNGFILPDTLVTWGW